MIWPPCFSWVQISANKVVYGSSPCPRTMGLHIFYWKGPPCPRTKGALSLSLPGQKQNQSFKCTQFTHPNSLYVIIASPPQKARNKYYTLCHESLVWVKIFPPTHLFSHLFFIMKTSVIFAFSGTGLSIMIESMLLCSIIRNPNNYWCTSGMSMFGLVWYLSLSFGVFEFSLSWA